MWLRRIPIYVVGRTLIAVLAGFGLAFDYTGESVLTISHGSWGLIGLIAFAVFVLLTLVREIQLYLHSYPNLIFVESRESPLYDRDTKEPKYHTLQAWFNNNPKTANEGAVAKAVTARISFYDKSNKTKLDVYGVFVQAIAFDLLGYEGVTNKLDCIEPNDEPFKLVIAIKWQEDDNAYAFVMENRSIDARNTRWEIKKGSHYVKVRLRGIGVNQPSMWFTLENLGQNAELSPLNPIKKPNLHKEGFQNE